MNNDLISRSELIEAIRKRHCIFSLEYLTEQEKAVVEEIYNAPTVCGNNPKWCESCVSKGKCASTRPQGEWIVITKSTFPQYQPDEYECPSCRVIVNHKTNFCPNCGADMRKEACDEG